MDTRRGIKIIGLHQNTCIAAAEKLFAVCRNQINYNLPRSSRQAASLLGFIEEHSPTHSFNLSSVPRRCYMCSTSSCSACDTCARTVCPRHRQQMKSCKCQTFNLKQQFLNFLEIICSRIRKFIGLFPKMRTFLD